MVGATRLPSRPNRTPVRRHLACQASLSNRLGLCPPNTAYHYRIQFPNRSVAVDPLARPLALDFSRRLPAVLVVPAAAPRSPPSAGRSALTHLRHGARQRLFEALQFLLRR